jgi:hypothetical protein
MTRPQLRLSAVVLSVLIVIVAAHALDHLPSGLRTQIDSERAAFAASQSQLAATRGQIDSQIQSAPDLFTALPFGAQWPARFDQASSELHAASGDVDELTRLEKSDSHGDSDKVTTLLAAEKKLRAQALSEATAIQSDAAHWIDASKNLPQELPELERAYQAVHNYDLGPLTAAVQRAETDWPDKKSDLDSRLSAERAIITQADTQWQATATARQQAAAGKLKGAGAATLLNFEDNLKTAAATLPRNATELNTLSTQLYTSWDKLLVDMKSHGSEYQQQIRTVSTHLTDATAKTGDVTSNEQWNTVPRSTYDAMRNDLGMAVEHKPAGKYDTEAEHVAQPAGMAYVAPPSQGSNQYGYWDHRDGRDFWVFYGQYALMRDLLFNHNYTPFNRYEWEDYRNYSMRGQTYYGRDTETSTPKYGSQGTVTQKGYSSSNYAHSGGFRDSQYASKSGSYRSSPYSSPAAREPGGDSSPKTFGHLSPSSTPRAAPPARTYRPSPSPSRSPGRTFGRRH